MRGPKKIAPKKKKGGPTKKNKGTRGTPQGGKPVKAWRKKQRKSPKKDSQKK